MRKYSCGDIMRSNDIYNIVGKNIKKYRKLNNLTQRQLADKLLLSESFIAKLESNTHQTISLDTLEQISLVLNTDIKNLFDKE
jgi:transcriptional regulator with XRE-family HTH domain